MNPKSDSSKGFQFHPTELLSRKAGGLSECDWTDKSKYRYILLARDVN